MVPIDDSDFVQRSSPHWRQTDHQAQKVYKKDIKSVEASIFTNLLTNVVNWLSSLFHNPFRNKVFIEPPLFNMSSPGNQLETAPGEQTSHKKANIQEISAKDDSKGFKINTYISDLAYETTKADALSFITNKPTTSSPLQTSRRPPMLDPSDLFTVKLKKSPASSSINVSEAYSESARKQVKFNRCAKQLTQIYPHLFVSGDIMARNKEELNSKKIKYILNLAPSVCKNYFEKDFEYHTINLIDSTSENDLLWAFVKGFAIIEKATASKPCFVHCHQGVSRSGAIVVAYVMLKEKLSFREAFEVVKSKHEVCSPNAAFIAQLILLEKRLLNENDSFEEEIFLMSKHSTRDDNIVLKSMNVDKLLKDNSTSLGNVLDVVDSRGTFVVYKSKEELDNFVSVLENNLGTFTGVFFVYQGKDDVHKVSNKLAALDYINLLKTYIPKYAETKTVHAEATGKLVNIDAKFDLFALFGAPTKTITTQEFMDSYFANVAATLPKSLVSNLEPKVNYEHMMVHLFTYVVDDSNEPFEYLEDYCTDDLGSKNACILEAYDEQDNTVKHFIWLGRDIETIISAEKITELCTAEVVKYQGRYIRNTKNVMLKDISIEHEGSESQFFQMCFQNGL